MVGKYILVLAILFVAVNACSHYRFVQPGEDVSWIAYPNYPGFYPSGYGCNWNINTVPNANIHLQCKDVELNGNELHVHDGESWRLFPYNFQLDAPRLTVRLVAKNRRPGRCHCLFRAVYARAG